MENAWIFVCCITNAACFPRKITRHHVIPDSVPLVEPLAAIYARVSSAESKSNLDAQAERLAQYAVARGWKVVQVVKEVGSGVNDHRKKLERLLADASWNILVVNQADDQKADLMQDLVEVIYSFSARMCGLRRSRRNTEKIVACLKAAAETRPG